MSFGLLKKLVQKREKLQADQKEIDSLIVRLYEGLEEKVISIVVAIIIIAIGLGYVALPLFFAINTSTWNSTVATIWPYIVVMAIVSIFLGFVYYMKHKGN